MVVKIYESSADNRVVDKTEFLNLKFNFEFVQLKQETSIMNIELIFAVNIAEMETLANCNYVYIESLNTYYFINDISFLSGNRVRLSCSEDVLMTYRNDIKRLQCVIARQENYYNAYLDDPNYKVYNYRRIQTLEFPNGFNSNDSQFILAVAGGGE